MKKIFYALFAFFFRIGRLFPVKENRVALLSPHRGGSHDSLGELNEFLRKKGGYEIIDISTSQLGSLTGAIDFFLNKSRALATSAYVFMNDNFMPMASLNFSEKTKVVMLWHAEGAFKKFGLLSGLDPHIAERQKAIGKRLTNVVCSSVQVAPVYAGAFGVDESKVLPLGSPRTDYLLNYGDTSVLRNEFDTRFPVCKGRKLVLYAPTFRDSPERDRELLSHINIKKFSDTLGDEYALLIKLHPQVHSSEIPENAINVTDCDIGNLTLICDMVITDYSSVCMDFALLGKPCLFFAYDLEKYKDERSFCFGYEDYVPGPVFKTFDEVIAEIKDPGPSDKLAKFREFNFGATDGRSTERVYNTIMK